MLLAWLAAAAAGVVAIGQEEEAGEPAAEEEGEETVKQLAFLQAHYDGVDGVDGLNGAYGLALSPDGKQVYVASMNDDAVSVFDRDVATGQLAFQTRYRNGENGISGLDGARSLAVSPDGKQLYAVSMFDDSLVTFARNTGDGSLAYLGRLKDGEGGLDGLDGARSLAISPDGHHVYVGGWNDNALAIFGRDPVSGSVSFLGRLKHNEDGVTGLDAPHFVTVSPDGKNVYVALWDEDAISYFARDAATGLLAYQGKVVHLTGDVRGLDGPRGIAFSPDGKFAYAATWNSDAVVTFERDSEGELSFASTIENGAGDVEEMDGPHSIVASPEGDFVYVAAFFSDAISVFRRDSETGALAYDHSISNSDEEVSGLNGALTIALGPDGEYAYATTSNDRSLVAFSREIVIEPPVFAVQPTSKSIPLGDPATFHALAEGSGVTYQWKRNGEAIEGATKAVYTIAAVSDSMDGEIYTVLASNGGGEVESEEAALTVLAPVTLEAPMDLTALDVSNSSVRLSWSDLNTAETGYEIQRKVASGEYETIASVFANVVKHDDTTLDPGTTYLYRVRAKKNAEISLWSNEAVIESHDDPPSAPGDLRVTGAAYNRVALRWSDRSAVEDGYRIERRTEGGAFQALATVGRSIDVYEDRSVDPDRSYAYRVQAYNDAGTSAFSNSVVGITESIPVSSITPIERNLPAEASDGHLVLVSSSSEWEAMASQDWIVVQSPAGGKGVGSQSVSYSVRANTSTEARAGEIDIGGRTHLVSQAAAEPFLEISPADSNFAATGGTVTLAVSSNIAWNAVADAAWISIVEGSSGAGDGLIRYSVEPNAEPAARSGIISVNDVEHPVLQAGIHLYLNVDPPHALFDRHGGVASLGIESNAAWVASASATWIQLSGETSGAGDGKLDFSVLANQTGSWREGMIQVNDTQVRIAQSGSDDKPIAPSETQVPWEGGSGFSADLPYAEGADLTVADSWISVTSISVSGGVATVVFQADENGDESERTGLIAVGEEKHAVRQEGKPVAPPQLDAFQIAGGAQRVSSNFVQLDASLSGGPAIEYRVSEQLSFSGAAWMPFEFPLSFALSEGAGIKRVYFQARNASGETAILSDTVEFSPLAAPANLQADLSSGLGALLLWEDRSGNETGFRVERAGAHGDAWTEIGTAPADQESFLDDTAKPGDAYRYRVQAFNEELKSGYVEILTETLPLSRLVNLSTRAHWGKGAKSTIAGFVIRGEGEIPLLARGVGPRLAAAGVSRPIGDPSARIRNNRDAPLDPDRFVNDDWGSALDSGEMAELEAALGAATVADSPKESVVLELFTRGSYSLILGNELQEEGIALVELFLASEFSADSARLINLSTRGFVGTGDSVMIGGFVIRGEAPLPVLIRGVGPGLAGQGVPGTLEDPRLVLRRIRKGVATEAGRNEDWGDEEASILASLAAKVGAFELEAGSADAALAAVLEPGVYVAELSGADGGVGIALLEIYVTR